MFKKNFTKKDLAIKLHKELGFSKNKSFDLTSDFFTCMVNELGNLKKIKISSFGTFEVFTKKERVGRNPKTKKEFQISARRVVRFKPSIFIKNKINKI